MDSFLASASRHYEVNRVLLVQKTRAELEELEEKSKQGDMNFLMQQLMERDFNKRLKKIVDSTNFDLFILFIIFCNCLTIAQETENCQHAARLEGGS